MTAERMSPYPRPYQPPGIDEQQHLAIGLSMFPALLPGDRVDIVSMGTVSSGNIIAFIAGDGNVLVHRVAGCSAERTHILTSGDANLDADAPVPVQAVIGSVQRVQRFWFGRWVVVPCWLWSRSLVPRRAANGFIRVAMSLVGAWRIICRG